MAARGRPSRGITTYPILLRVPEPLYGVLETYYQDILRRPLGAGAWHLPSRNDILLSLLAEALQAHQPAAPQGETPPTDKATPRAVPPKRPAQPRAPATEQAEIPLDDTRKVRLGRLCPRGHDYQGTGKSLRRATRAGDCVECGNEQRREKRRAAKR